MNYSSLVLGADISHYQQRPDFGRLAADGVRFVIIKATESLAVDPDFDWNRNEAARRGMPWMAYPFIRPDDTTATTLNFARVVGGRVPAALDWEASGVRADRVEVWMDNCEELLGRAGIAYYGIYPPAPPTARIESWPRWLPRYAAEPGLPPWDGRSAVRDWSAAWFIWQYTGNGRLPGVATTIDLNRLSCPWDTFRAWYDTGVLPAEAPQVVPESAAPLHMHSAGPAVSALQQRLAALGQHVGVDGDYGPQTRGAVAAFQAANKLPASGIADLATIRALNR